MQNRNILCPLLLIAIACQFSCSKGGHTTDTTTPPTPTPPPVVTPKTCLISGISQRNSGNKAEFGLTITYDNNLRPTSVSVYDSLLNISLFRTNLTYASADSIRIDSYQYMKLDGNGRVVVFVTSSDPSNPQLADEYRYEYTYNSEGYLATKNLFINRSKKANYSTTYSYTGNLLTSCIMLAASSGNLKILESTLSYDFTVAPKTMFYCFPDGFENFYYAAALNFGNRPANPLAKVTTKLYNPANSTLLDTWTTTYSNYSLDMNGYLTGGIASGDLQQGMASFYGKTFFSYQCQ